MCIICNCPTGASAFLYEFSKAQEHMRKATEAMHAVSKIAFTDDQKKQYDRTHKQMVRLQTEWNKIEHTREHKAE